MSDDLIKRLDELIAEDMYLSTIKLLPFRDCIEQLEAKLAKAMEALRDIASYDTGATAGLAYTASTVLAELES